MNGRQTVSSITINEPAVEGLADEEVAVNLGTVRSTGVVKAMMLLMQWLLLVGWHCHIHYHNVTNTANSQQK